MKLYSQCFRHYDDDTDREANALLTSLLLPLLSHRVVVVLFPQIFFRSFILLVSLKDDELCVHTTFFLVLQMWQTVNRLVQQYSEWGGMGRDAADDEVPSERFSKESRHIVVSSRGNVGNCPWERNRKKEMANK